MNRDALIDVMDRREEAIAAAQHRLARERALLKEQRLRLSIGAAPALVLAELHGHGIDLDVAIAAG